MAFDRTSQADLDALHTEVFTDPITMGYNPTGNTQQLLQLLNDPNNNVGGETTGDRLTVGLLFDAALAAPDDLNVIGQFSEGDQIIIMQFLQQDLSKDIEEYRSRIEAILPNGTMLTTLQSQTRAISRAEVLFGVGTTISRDDWTAARDNGGMV